MEHQDHNIIVIGNNILLNKNNTKKIVPKNRTDQRAIKIENETENFKIQKIPPLLSKEITQARVSNKKTQLDMSKLLNKPVSMYQELENGKANYDPSTKLMIRTLSRKLNIKFNNL